MSRFFFRVVKLKDRVSLGGALSLNQKFKDIPPNFLPYGGGICFDGVKLEATGRKYYNVVMHYLDTKRRPFSFGRGIDWSIKR